MKKCINHIILLGIGYEAWLICDNEDASKKTFVATRILVFDFGLFVGERFQRPCTSGSELALRIHPISVLSVS
jgi:hypothetical protein